MKSPTLRLVRAFLFPVLFLLIPASVLKAGESGVHPGSSTAASLLPPPPDEQLLVNLMVVLPGNVEGLADGLRMRYNTGYLRSIVDDAVKMNNFSENLSSYRENTDLIVERRPPIVLFDIVFLRLTNTTIRDYRLLMYAKSFNKNQIAYVQDAWLNRYQLIDLSGDTTRFNFSVTADPASRASNRFRIVFAPFGALPVHFTGISAVPVNNKVRLQWTTADDAEVKQYEIERSSNGRDFSIAGIVDPGSNIGYSWVD